jgi:hypothetical protein
MKKIHINNYDNYATKIEFVKDIIIVVFDRTTKKFKYCQRQIEEESKCKIQCLHCKNYYEILEFKNK